MSDTDAGKKSRDAPTSASPTCSASCASKAGSAGTWCSTSPANSTSGRPTVRRARRAPPCDGATTRTAGSGSGSIPILIVEKDTLEPVCQPMAQRWQMPFASSRGYSSLKLQHDVAEMLRHRHARTGQRASSTSSAISIPAGSTCNGHGRRPWRTSASRVSEFPRIGLTREQVRLERV